VFALPAIRRKRCPAWLGAPGAAERRGFSILAVQFESSANKLPRILCVGLVCPVKIKMPSSSLWILWPTSTVLNWFFLGGVTPGRAYDDLNSSLSARGPGVLTADSPAEKPSETISGCPCWRCRRSEDNCPMAVLEPWPREFRWWPPKWAGA